MKVHSLMLQLQEAAARHADMLGWGMDWLRKNGSMWVLANFGMDIIRLPRWSEEVSLFTWPAGHDPIRAFREFKGIAVDGSDLFTATSDWIIVDIERKTPRILAEVNFNVADPGKRSLPPAPRIREAGDYPPFLKVTVGGSSIDMNTHVNNTEYIRWGMDALSIKGIDVGSIRSFSITFSAELFQGDELEVGIRSDGTAQHLRGMRAGDGKTAFLMDVIAFKR